MTALLAAEWIKVRSLRSASVLIALTVGLCVGLGYLVGLSFGVNFDSLPAQQQASFDPLFPTFYSLTLGQLPLVVLAAFAVTSEYSSGTIQVSLTAVPRRGLFYIAKIGSGALVAAATAVVSVLLTFPAAQAGLGQHGTTLSAPGVPQAVIGACLYLVLMFLLGSGLAMLLRGSIPTLAILLPLLFLGSQGLGNIPAVKNVAQYLPDQAGQVILHVAGQGDDPRFLRPYGPWEGLAITALWTVAALLAGYLALRRRDV